MSIVIENIFFNFKRIKIFHFYFAYDKTHSKGTLNYEMKFQLWTRQKLMGWVGHSQFRFPVPTHRHSNPVGLEV